MEPFNESEIKFLKTLQMKSKSVSLYENLNLLKYASDLVPTEELNMNATIKLSVLENEDNSVSLEDLILIELLNWFNLSFFSWVDIPNCELCGKVPERKGFTPPSETELMWGAHQVEMYFCSFCQISVRFPRYTHPRKLLETRRGRCGEWANCFTLMCRALGYDARFVSDWQDHVWTEVFSFSKSRWMHCDPCENICDKPLMYEIGWKKPMSYVIAFSKDEVQDVTWRYTSNFTKTLQRRTLCREEWLLHCITSFIEKLQTNASLERKRELLLRRVMELAEFLTPPEANEELHGRTSGSLAWRLARAETWQSQEEYTFTLSDKEIVQKYFHVKYSCASDKYVRISSEETEKTWMAYAFQHSSVFRKVEKDWKQAYLARTEGSPEGRITWKFSCENTGLVIDKLKLFLNSSTFEDGKVKWTVSSHAGRKHTENFEQGNVKVLTKDFQGSSCLSISAELSGGTRKNSWQHAQLFRQALDSLEFPFEIEIYLCTI